MSCYIHISAKINEFPLLNSKDMFHENVKELESLSYPFIFFNSYFLTILDRQYFIIFCDIYFEINQNTKNSRNNSFKLVLQINKKKKQQTNKTKKQSKSFCDIRKWNKSNLQSATLLKLTLLYGCNCKNGTELRKVSHILENLSHSSWKSKHI